MQKFVKQFILIYELYGAMPGRKCDSVWLQMIKSRAQLTLCFSDARQEILNLDIVGSIVKKYYVFVFTVFVYKILGNNHIFMIS